MQSVIIEEPYNFHQPHLPRECYRVSKGQDGARSCVSWGQAMAWETSALSVYLFRALGLRQVLALCRALWIHALLDTLCTGPFQVALVVKSLPAKAGDIRDECNCAVVWAFLGITFLWDWNENRPFPVLWPLLSFPNLLAYWVQHFHSIIFQDLK